MSERILALEALVSAAAETSKALMSGQAPRPAMYAATLGMFGGLSLVSAVGPSGARLAASLGGLIVLGEFLAPTGPGRWLVRLYEQLATVQKASFTTAAAATPPPNPSPVLEALATLGSTSTGSTSTGSSRPRKRARLNVPTASTPTHYQLA